MIEKAKICTKCGIKKPINEFYSKKSGCFGVAAVCRICELFLKKIYQQTNKEKIKNRKALYYMAHKEQISIRAAIYYKAHKKESRAQKAIYYKNHKDEAKIYKAKHAEERRAYVNKRHKANPKLRLNHSISAGIHRSLKGNQKGVHWEDLVGYTIEKLKKHLEKQFLEGMTWQNYGEWHLEHKIPISVYNFAEHSHRDFKRCWALKNLRPMWAQDNLTKHAKLTKHFQPSLCM